MTGKRNIEGTREKRRDKALHEITVYIVHDERIMEEQNTERKC